MLRTKYLSQPPPFFGCMNTSNLRYINALIRANNNMRYSSLSLTLSMTLQAVLSSGSEPLPDHAVHCRSFFCVYACFHLFVA